jgi:hypothetical protein
MSITATTEICSRIRDNTLMALASGIPPFFAINNSDNFRAYSKNTVLRWLNQIRNAFFGMHTEKLLVGGRFRSLTNKWNGRNSIDTMHGNTK